MEMIRCCDCWWLGEEEDLNYFELPEDEYNELDSPYAKGCPNCKTDKCLVDINYDCEFSQDELERLWKYLLCVRVNDKEEINEEFLGFPAGTPRQKIWDWFDKSYTKGGVKKLLTLPRWF